VDSTQCIFLSQRHLCGSLLLPPMSYQFVIHSDLEGYPYMELYTRITYYSMMGDFILLGDFNGHTISL
jgi:hypothetical protein